MLNIKTIKLEQELNLQLYVLYENLMFLENYNYDEKTERKLKDFINYVESILFKPLPSGFDITDIKCTYTTFLEEYKN